MPKTIFALIAAGILGAAMVPTAAGAMVPNDNTTMSTGQPTLAQERARLKHDRALLRRDVRLGKTTEAAHLRKQINADERAISRAQHGMEQGSTAQQGSTARTMQPTQPKQPAAHPSQTDTQTTPPGPKNQA